MLAESQYADPEVSRRKFDREITEFQSHADEYRSRGWFLVQAEFPNVLVILGTPKTIPPAIVCGVQFDYSNYDADPPSVRFVDPFTCEPYRFDQLPIQLNRSVPNGGPTEVIPGGVQIHLQQEQPLMIAHRTEDIPFLCLAGVREYHRHPAHSGDHWELHRPSGAGRLIRLLEIISKYGIEPIAGFQVQMIPQVLFQRGPSPE